MSDNISNDKVEAPLSAETLKMIEEKRRLAIERRNQKLVNEKVQVSFTNNSQSSSNAPTVRLSPIKSFFGRGNTNTMTSIRPKESSSNVQPKYFSNKTPYSRPYPSRPYSSRPNTSRPNSSGPNPSRPNSSGPNHSQQNDVKQDPKQQTNTKQDLIATTRLVSNKRFEIVISYNADVLTIFRKFKSKDYNAIKKIWSFDISDYKQLMSELTAIPSVNIKFEDPVPETVIVSLIKSINREKTLIDLRERLTNELVDELFPFQRDGIIFGIERQGRCLVADDMGLGKTIQAICLAQWFRSDWPLLIICPSSLRYQWQNSLNRWLPHLSSDDIMVVKHTKEYLPQIPITIISYDLLARMRSQFAIENKRIYNMVILDESHYIKTDTAMRTEAVLLLAKSAKRVVLLTGTPALSRPMELFPQITVIDPKLFPSKHNFGLRYCDAQLKNIFFKGQKGAQKHVWDYKGAKNLDELRILLEETILIRRLKKDVLDQLPKKKREMFILGVDHLSDKQQKKLCYYQDVVRKLCHKRQENTCLFEWYGESAIAKLAPVCEYIDQLLEKNIKFLCFCHHKSMMDGIEETLHKKKVNHIRIDGSTLPGLRQEACDEFQNSEDCKVAILSITACATGLNLTAASTVVFAEIYWNPGVLSQAEDRVHRIGQQENCRIIYLVAKNTIDDMIWPLISKKLDVLNKAGLSKDNFKEASCALDALKSDQQLITEFFQSLDEDELKAFMEDDFKEDDIQVV